MENRYLKLKKGKTTLIVDKIGAQIVSFNVDGLELFHHGAINAFPTPGKVGKNDYEEYTHNGGVYVATKNGFAQYEEFKDFSRAEDEDRCFLSISSERNKTYTKYPYNCKCDIDLQIDEGELLYKMHVRNIDNKPMLTGMSWHTGFALHDRPSKYSIVFKNLKCTDKCGVEEGLKYPIYDEKSGNFNSTVFAGIESADVLLVYSPENGKDIPYLSMHTEEPYLVLRGKLDKNSFVCIEPWNTTPGQIHGLTTQDKTLELKEKGALIVEAGGYKTLQAKIDTNPKYIKLINTIKKRERVRIPDFQYTEKKR